MPSETMYDDPDDFDDGVPSQRPYAPEDVEYRVSPADPEVQSVRIAIFNIYA